jgi:hypothetical protein
MTKFLPNAIGALLMALLAAGCSSPGQKEAMEYQASLTERADALVSNTVTAEEQQVILAAHIAESDRRAAVESAIRIADYRAGRTVKWGGDGPIVSSFLWQRELGLGTFTTSYKEGDAFSGPLQQAVLQFKTDDQGRPLLVPQSDGSFAPIVFSANIGMETPTGRWAGEQIVTFGSALGANLGAAIATAELTEGCEGCNNGVIVGSVGAVANAVQRTDVDVKSVVKTPKHPQPTPKPTPELTM